MKQAAHTPGPWKVSADGKSVSGADKDCRAFIAHLVVNSDTMFTIGRSEANARLIAAAPDLLEALTDIATRKGWENFPDEAAYLAAVTDHARKAIAKALGEQA